jgi:hypothetical protein
MRYLDHPALRELAVAITDADSADQSVDARLELYTLDSHQSEPSGASPSESPRHLHKSAKQLIHHFICALSETFPDYKFDGLSQESFTHREDLNAVVNYINQTLGCTFERTYPRVVPDLWRTLRQVIQFNDCDLYELTHDVIDESKLWSFCYFWFDKRHHRILLLSCRSRSKHFKTISDGDSSMISWDDNKSVSSRGDSISIDAFSSNEDD